MACGFDAQPWVWTNEVQIRRCSLIIRGVVAAEASCCVSMLDHSAYAWL